MANHVWCHGPNCHIHETVDRVRGSKGSKVLRTRKVKQWRNESLYDWFCSQGCYNEFANEYVEQIVRIAPRTTPLETPCEVKTETYTDYYDKPYTVKRVDKLSNVG